MSEIISCLENIYFNIDIYMGSTDSDLWWLKQQDRGEAQRGSRTGEHAGSTVHGGRGAVGGAKGGSTCSAPKGVKAKQQVQLNPG